jgi:hypothetical protein
LYQQTNGGSRYTFDPEYGGKIDVAARRGHDGGAAPPAASAPARGAPDRPRVREPFGSEAVPRCAPGGVFACCSVGYAVSRW